MSLFTKMFRGAAAAASVAIVVNTATAQPPAPTPLDQIGPANSEAVVPASGWRGPFGSRGVPCPPQAIPCPPGTIPGTMPPTVPPGMNPGAQPAPNFGDLSRGADVGSGAGLKSPNLFGDLFGSPPSQVFTRQTTPGFLNGKTVVFAVNGVMGTAPGTVSGNVRNGTVSLRDASGLNVIAVPSVSIAGLPLPVSNPVRLSTLGINGSFTEYVPVGGGALYTPTGVNAASANYVLQYFLGNTSARSAGVPFTIPAVVPAGAGRDLLAVPIEKAMNPQARLESLTVGPVQAALVGSELRYQATISDTISTPSVLVSVPNPGTGGVVGIIKISEDNNPMPRDRVIFNYDYFDNVPLTPTGIPVNRYQFGVEKTLFDGRMSVEARLPFASTLNSEGGAMSNGTNTELGNVRLAAKALLLRREKVNVSTGLSIFLPTADDFSVTSPGSPRGLINVENTSVQLSPYVAVLYTPNERFFSQAWFGMTFDTGGNKVTVDPNMFGGTGDVGSLRGGNLLTADLQIGYWVYQSDAGFVRGLAPFAELHYNTSVSQGAVLSAGNGVFIGDTGGGLDELNISAGVTSNLAENATLSVGFAAPLRSSANRTFDYQIGVRFNWFFGYTAQQNQSRRTSVSTFGQ